MQPFDQRRAHLMKVAARTFAERGFHRTSMRDLSRASEMSLAGMYYYVKGKEDLLFHIQKACCEQLMAGAARVVGGGAGPAERLAAFIRHHVTFFSSHMAEMKLLSHEAESLSGAALEEVRGLQRSYTDLGLGLLADLEAERGGAQVDRHVAAYTLFGMMNWIYTWYDPQGPVGVDALSDAICRLFLNGYTPGTDWIAPKKGDSLEP
jgi:AcrR family transcriptional regulator